MQESTRGGDPPAVQYGALEIADAGLVAAVVIRVARDAEADAAGNEGFRQRMDPVIVGDGNAALPPAARFVAEADAAFATPVIGQAIGIAPAAIAALRPIV